VCEVVHKIATNKIELKRRIVAQNIFDSLLIQLQKEIDRVSDIKIVLENVDKTLDNEIAKLQNYTSKKVNLFDIDLGADFVTTVTVNTDEILIGGFINSLPSKNLYNINNQDTIAGQMENYTRGLAQTKIYEEMTIDDRLAGMSDKDFNKLLKDAIAKANPLIDIDKQGFLEVNDSIAKQFYVGVYRKGSSRVETTPAFKENLNADEKVDFIPTGMKDRVVLYRLEGPMPAFAVSTIINTCESEYKIYMDDKQKICPNFDQNLLNRMIMEEFSLMPGDDINVAMKYWVMGFVFGYIKRKNSNYYYLDTNNLSKGDRALVSLKTKKRTEAYIEFRKNISYLRDMYDDYLKKTIINNAVDARDKFAQASTNDSGEIYYFNNIADCEVGRGTIKADGYKEIRNLIDEEISFVTATDKYNNRGLLNAIENYIN
jgi:hypothetical protein